MIFFLPSQVKKNDNGGKENKTIIFFVIMRLKH